MSDARSLPDRVDAVVAGAGLAGASAARALALRGLSVLVLEAETMPGTHASGRNAAILRRVLEDPSTAALARRGGAALADPPGDLDLEHPLLDRHGVLLVAGEGRAADALRRAAGDARGAGLAVEDLDASAAEARAPVLREAPVAAAAWHPDDGTVDVAALLAAMLRSARTRGAVVAPGAGLLAVRTAGGSVSHVDTSRGPVRTGILVDAAGAAADPVAALAGLAPLRFVPRRRHLFQLGANPLVAHGSPTVWDVDRGVYLRPEGTGVLASPCDEAPFPPGLEEPRVVPAVRAVLGDKLERCFPRYGRFTVRRAWAGLRTFAPDGRFVIGPDPRLRGFAWAAGLGGHGVSTAVAVGEVLADLVLDGRTATVDAAAVLPDRLLR
jgi:D-arginine dehydrogenase